MRKTAKHAARAAAAALLAAGVAGQAQAQGGITFVGSTQGCFAATDRECGFGNNATLGGLSFTSQSFALETDDDGFSAAGNPSNGFGLLSLSNTPFTYTGSNFFLQVTFAGMGVTNSAGGPSNSTSPTCRPTRRCCAGRSSRASTATA